MNEIEEQARDFFYADAAQYNIPIDTQSMLVASAETWRERYDALTKYIQGKAR